MSEILSNEIGLFCVDYFVRKENWFEVKIYMDLWIGIVGYRVKRKRIGR